MTSLKAAAQTTEEWYGPPDQLGAKALWYAAHGFSILPLHWIINGQCSCGKPECQSPGKRQLTLHGLDDATYNLNKIEEY